MINRPCLWLLSLEWKETEDNAFRDVDIKEIVRGNGSQEQNGEREGEAVASAKGYFRMARLAISQWSWDREGDAAVVSHVYLLNTKYLLSTFCWLNNRKALNQLFSGSVIDFLFSLFFNPSAASFSSRMWY